MNAIVDYLGDAQFEVKARGHRIYSDQPIENGGFDEAMTPPELLLASLGTCAAYYAAEYLKARSLPAEGLQVTVFAEKAAKPARLASFGIKVVSHGLDEERHREGLLRAVKKCLIHNTLLHPPTIDVDIEMRPGALEAQRAA